MKIQITTKTNLKLKNFNKKEWPIANIEHFGSNVDWKTKNYILNCIEKNKIIGTLGIRIEGGVGYIGTMIVAKTKQGKGIGGKLMDKAIVIAKKEKAHKIYLQTGKDWKSIQFYKKFGYKITAELKNHYFHKNFVELTLYI
ncbi:GNAT family N-acetyltransferase [Candidatus Roizmanbacteria bacterium]|jgi:ribosomal protein S18 acetylase RimI-like enzyme|nr:GNAT family N-acetyltransferase [Candidatus Roizmanbacteria bacterium]